MIGQLLKKQRNAARPDLPAEVEVVGQRDGAFIVSDARTFAPPVTLSAVDLAQVYGSDGSAPVEVDEVALQTAVAAEQLRRDVGGYAAADRSPAGHHEPDPDSAEGQFAAAARAQLLAND